MLRQIHRPSYKQISPFKFHLTLFPCFYMVAGIIFTCVFCLSFTPKTEAQIPVFPDKIHGYKVHRKPIALNTGKNPQNNSGEEAFIKMTPPGLKNVGLSGITFEVSGEVLSPQQSAKIDFLTFHEIRVNGIAVSLEDYRHPFAITKAEPVILPQPAKIMLPTAGILHAVWKEMSDSQEKWKITGRVLVFGKFRKLGFYHKRVIPVDIDLMIDNPLAVTQQQETEEQ